jgi:CO/xanthine dehydrogenase Mo-binding subunit
MDELAARVKVDPVAYRLRHLKHPRLSEALKAATTAANWTARPSPNPANRKTGVATGRGVSCVAYEGDNGYCALVAEVEVNQTTGKVTVKRIVTSADSGPVSNPDVSAIRWKAARSRV